MVFNLITFLLLLLCLYLAILYQSTAACALFLFLFIDWILELMILLYSRRHLKIELPDIIINDNEANKLLEFHLQAQNTGIFPMPYLRLKWHFTDAFQNKISLPDYYFSLNAKKTSVLSGTISNDYYGKFHLQANKVRIYSFTHLLSLPVACKAKADILFYPSPFVIPIQLSEGIRFFSAECDGFEEIISGTCSYHTSDIREFLPGDKLRQIHWKLSARTDQLLVKETGRPKGFPVLLFLEKGKSDKKASPSQYSTFLQYAASLSYSFLYYGCNHFVVWYNEKEHALLRIPIQNEEDYLSFLHQLLYETLTASKENLYSLYSHTYPCDTYFTAFLLNTDLQIYQNQQLLLDCSGNTSEALKNNTLIL